MVMSSQRASSSEITLIPTWRASSAVRVEVGTPVIRSPSLRISSPRQRTIQAAVEPVPRPELHAVLDEFDGALGGDELGGVDRGKLAGHRWTSSSGGGVIVKMRRGWGRANSGSAPGVAVPGMAPEMASGRANLPPAARFGR